MMTNKSETIVGNFVRIVDEPQYKRNVITLTFEEYDQDNCRYHKILVNGVSAWNYYISVFLARALFLVDVDDPEELQVEGSHVIDNNIPTHRTVVGNRRMPIMKR